MSFSHLFKLLFCLLPCFLSATTIYFPFEEEMKCFFYNPHYDKEYKWIWIYVDGHWYVAENLRHYDGPCPNAIHH